MSISSRLAEHIAVHPYDSVLLVPTHWNADCQRDIAQSTPALLQRLRPEQIDSAGFYRALPSALLEEIYLARWLIVRVEATAPTAYCEPIRVTKHSTVAGMPWPIYRAHNHNATASTSPRMRVLTIQLERLGTIAFDMDSLSAPQISNLCDAVLSTQTLVGHDIAFDIQWMFRESNLRPTRLIDVQLLCAGIKPLMLLQPFVAESAAGKCSKQAAEAIRRVKADRDWRASALLNLLSASLGLTELSPAFSNRISWCVSVLSPGHKSYCTNALQIMSAALNSIFPDVPIEQIPQNIDKVAKWYAFSESALLRLIEASIKGVPFDRAESLRFERHCVEKAEDLAFELASFPTFERLQDELLACGTNSEALKAAIAKFAAEESLTLNRSLDGSVRTGIDDLTEAGFSRAPWWRAWIQRSEALNHAAAVAKFARFATAEGRLHPAISMSTATGRSSANEPSVQNMPRDDRFRALVRARPDHVILALDFSAIELRIAAALAIRAAKEISRLIEGRFKSGEESRLRWLLPTLRSSTDSPEDLSFAEEPINAEMHQRICWIKKSLQLATHRVITNEQAILANVFKRDLDPHLVTALDLARRAGKLTFPGSSLEWLSSQTLAERTELRNAFEYERQAAKACNFGLLYGMSPGGLHRLGMVEHGLVWSLDDAAQARMSWFDLYPDVRLWQLWTLHIRKIKQPISRYEIWDKHRRDLAAPPGGEANVYAVSTLSNRQFLILNDRHAALNYQNQGTGADILSRSIALLPPEVASMLILAVHDELVFEVPRSQVQTVEAIARSNMMAAADEVLRGRIPMKIESFSSTSWA